MDCCQCRGIEEQFDARYMAWQVARYRRRGPERTTRMLVEALIAAGVRGATVLDIGGGVGAIPHALLAAGAAAATSVEAASGAIAVAREEAACRNLSERMTFRHGDFVALADDLRPADVVTLDRVVCCYHDMPALVSRSAALAARHYGLVYPRDDAWWVRLGARGVNLAYRLQRRPFRLFAHSTAALDAILRREGLARRRRRVSGPWQVVLYERASDDGSSR